MTVAEIERPRRNGSQPPASASLWEAFTAAQQEFRAIVKDTQGQRGKYAPLDSVLDQVRPILNKHGLALTQPTFVDGDTLFVRTVIVHKTTGETHESVYPAGLLTLQHQQLGAGVTYARRYSLLSLAGVFPENEDDDGEKAGAAGGGRTPPRQQSAPAIAVRAAARPFIDKASAELEAAKGDHDAVFATFDAITARPGWAQLNAAERQEIILAKGRALPDVD